MKCKNCPGGRRFAQGSVNCLPYGMIIREDHEGEREYCKAHEGEEREEQKEQITTEEIEEGWW